MEDRTIRVLLVEDDRIDQMAFQRFVKAEDLPYRCTCVDSVGAGKDALASDEFDVVITDYRLGDGTGFELFPTVDPDVPIILVTGGGGEEVAVQALKAGASDYLIKDVASNYLKTLPTTVDKTIKAKRTERELKRYHEQLEKIVEERTLQLRNTNEELRIEIDERKKAQEALREAHDRLEVRVEQRTQELRATNEQLLRQVSERHKAEEDLKKSKETVEAILDASADCAFLLDRDGSFVAVNRPMAAMTDYSKQELLGRRYFDVISSQSAPNRRNRFDQVLRSGKTVRFEDHGDGNVSDHTFHPLVESDGSVERIAAFSRDITDQKKAHDMLVQRQRLAALGEMAGGVAHNFNNLLQIVIGATGLAESDLDLGDIDEVRTTLAQIAESAQLGSETVKQLQDFARVRTVDPTVEGKIFDLAGTARHALTVTRPFWKSGAERRGVKISMKYKLADYCFVKGNQNELFEVIVNLVKNSTEALSEGGKIYMKLYEEAGEVLFVIRDNGIGIGKDSLPKVFEPFWTTKGVQGTGMGLSTSFGIVTRHGGDISVKSEKGKGAEFTIRMPLAAQPEDESAKPVAQEVDFKARFLITDDDERVAALLEKELLRCGQTVFKAASGQDAIDVFQEIPVDMIICDLGMQDMNGWQVAKTVKGICLDRGVPKTPFILCTGWGGQLDEEEMIAECGVDRIAEKPLKFEAVLRMIGNLFEETDASRKPGDPKTERNG